MELNKENLYMFFSVDLQNKLEQSARQLSDMEYIIGIEKTGIKDQDRCTHDMNAYCLLRKLPHGCTLILSKIIRDEMEFDEEVANLAKYFNAKLIYTT